MARAQRLVAEAEALHHARPVALDEHVGILQQPREDLRAGLALEVGGDAALVALELQEQRALLGPAARRLHERPDRAQEVTRGRLQLHDLRAEVAELHRAERAGDPLRDIDDAQAVEGQP